MGMMEVGGEVDEGYCVDWLSGRLGGTAGGLYITDLFSDLSPWLDLTRGGNGRGGGKGGEGLFRPAVNSQAQMLCLCQSFFNGFWWEKDLETGTRASINYIFTGMCKCKIASFYIPLFLFTLYNHLNVDEWTAEGGRKHLGLTVARWKVKWEHGMRWYSVGQT